MAEKVTKNEISNFQFAMQKVLPWWQSDPTSIPGYHIIWASIYRTEFDYRLGHARKLPVTQIFSLHIQIAPSPLSHDLNVTFLYTIWSIKFKMHQYNIEEGIRNSRVCTKYLLHHPI